MPAVFRLLVLAAFVLLLPRVALAQKAGPGEAEVARVGSFVVFSDHDFAADLARKVIGRVEAAYEFVAAEEDWAKDSVLGATLGIRVLGDERMKEVSKNA